MFSGILLIAGLLLLFRGGFRIGARYVPAERTRIVAAIFMVPMLVQFCASSVIVFNSDIVTPDGKIDQAAFQDVVLTFSNQLTLMDFLVALIAMGISAYLVFYVPTSGTEPPAQQTGQPNHSASPWTMKPITPPVPQVREVPSVMTVGEAALYLRVAEADVMKLIEDGKLPAARIGGSYRIARIAIDDFISDGM